MAIRQMTAIASESEPCKQEVKVNFKLVTAFKNSSTFEVKQKRTQFSSRTFQVSALVIQNTKALLSTQPDPGILSFTILPFELEHGTNVFLFQLVTAEIF